MSGSGDDPAGPSGPADPGELLREVRVVRRRARRARHAYWFPLVLFGLLTAVSIPFYIRQIPRRSGVYSSTVSGPDFLRSSYLGGWANGGTAYYWLAALLLGAAATAAWYRWRGGRVGLRTPARGYVITGLGLLILAVTIPVIADLSHDSPLRYLMPGDLLIRGTFPFVIIGIGLCVLAWSERSVALTVIAALYLGLSLVASLYDIENVFFRLGWNLSVAASGLPNVVLPALVLLLSGAGAWVVQRRHRSRPPGEASGEVPAAGAPA